MTAAVLPTIYTYLYVHMYKYYTYICFIITHNKFVQCFRKFIEIFRKKVKLAGKFNLTGF